MKSQTPLLLTALLGALPACSGAPTVPHVAIDPSRSAGASSSEGDRLASVVTTARPAGFALDGDIGEWGNIVPPPPKPPPPVAPASHLAIAFAPDGVTLAGMLSAEAADGLWIGLLLGAPTLPPVGYRTGWGAVQPLDCDADTGGSPRAPEEIGECRVLIDVRDDMEVTHAARFRRVYKLDRTGLRAASADGTLAAVPGAKVAFKEGKAGITVEVSFPAKGLPRTEQAPLQQVGIIARAASGDKPPAWTAADFASKDLPAPVGFEPYADLRAAAFGLAGSRVTTPPNLSYQPGDGLELEDVEYDNGNTTLLEVKPHLLFSKQTTFGAFEVGYAYAVSSAVAVLKDGHLVDCAPIEGDPVGFAKRDDELHVFAYQAYQPGDDTAYRAEWSGVAVQKDGKLRPGLVDPGQGARRWADALPMHDPDFASFGITGMLPQDDNGRSLSATATWTWNPGEKLYGLKLETEDDEPAPPGKGKGAVNKSAVRKAAPKGKGRKE